MNSMTTGQKIPVMSDGLDDHQYTQSRLILQISTLQIGEVFIFKAHYHSSFYQLHITNPTTQAEQNNNSESTLTIIHIQFLSFGRRTWYCRCTGQFRTF